MLANASRESLDGEGFPAANTLQEVTTTLRRFSASREHPVPGAKRASPPRRTSSLRNLYVTNT